MANRKSTEYKPDLGPVPFHLGCNALAYHGNCALCNPDLGGTG